MGSCSSVPFMGGVPWVVLMASTSMSTSCSSATPVRAGRTEACGVMPVLLTSPSGIRGSPTGKGRWSLSFGSPALDVRHGADVASLTGASR